MDALTCNEISKGTGIGLLEGSRSFEWLRISSANSEYEQIQDGPLDAVPFATKTHLSFFLALEGAKIPSRYANATRNA